LESVVSEVSIMSTQDALRDKLEIWRRRQLGKKLMELEDRHAKEKGNAQKKLDAQLRHSVAKKLRCMELEQSLKDAERRCAELSARLGENGTTAESNEAQYSQAGGLQHDGNLFEDDTFLKKAQSHQTGCYDRENAFLAAATQHHVLQKFVPKFYGEVERDGVMYTKMVNVQHGFAKAAQLDIRMGTKTFSNEMSYQYRTKKYLLDSLTTTPSLGASVAGGCFRRDDGTMETAGSCYTSITSKEAFQKLLDKFLLRHEGNTRLLLCLQQKLKQLYEWFQKQTEYSFFSSSLLLLYDCSLEQPQELRVFMIDFAHTYPDGGTGDSGYLTGLETLLHMTQMEDECRHLTDSKVHTGRERGASTVRSSILGF